MQHSPTLPVLAGILSRYVLENPWPLAGLCLLVGSILAWKALREGHRPTLNVGAAIVAMGVVVIGLGASITTSAERAREVVANLVSRAETGDIGGMLDLMTPGCILHYGRPENPGFPRSEWEPSVGLLQGRYEIDQNTVTRLDAEGADGKAATVELACVTSISISPYPTPSAWWLRVAEQADGRWKIERIAFLRVGKQEATPGIF